MRKGGYKIIDLKDNNFTVGGSSITIPGIYEAIENSHRKAILLSGIVIGGIERNDRFVTFGIVSTDYIASVAVSDTANVLQCTVKADDSVKFTEI